ncbi:BgTH12-07168 [Blumeria graminis f. sp. triticale]|uniref:BgTH12-07168 n=1 Tax=Blumeria graminis f. sp. triticale TaxID=1689686 RepID=A0A9W4GIH6_BLUGR|nr:BgTH12-07168 [Blumeria graminis f. sp. triticale]
MFLHLFLMGLGLPFIQTLQSPATEQLKRGVSTVSRKNIEWLRYPQPFKLFKRRKQFPPGGIECLEWPIKYHEFDVALKSALREMKAQNRKSNHSITKGRFIQTYYRKHIQGAKLYMYPIYGLYVNPKGDIEPTPYLIISKSGKNHAVYMVTGGNVKAVPNDPQLKFSLCFSDSN